MELIGKTVRHKLFGIGEIVDFQNNYNYGFAIVQIFVKKGKAQ